MKKKLNLGELKVKSFITDLENGSIDTVKGGGGLGGVVGTKGEYVTKVHDCDKDTSPHRCRTQDRTICGEGCQPTQYMVNCDH